MRKLHKRKKTDRYKSCKEFKKDLNATKVVSQSIKPSKKKRSTSSKVLITALFFGVIITILYLFIPNYSEIEPRSPEEVATEEVVDETPVAEEIATEEVVVEETDIKPEAKEIAERKAKEITERKAEEIAERKAKEITERKAEEIAERKVIYARKNYRYESQRNAMIQHLISVGISDKSILKAMSIVPMELFVPSSYQSSKTLDLLYQDNPVPIGYQESISQPYMTAAMLKRLDLQKGDKVLELKTASGYQTVLLAEMGMNVTTIESDRKLAQHLYNIFNELDFPNIDFIVGDYLHSGWKKNGYYDAIIATAAYSSIPYEIRDQLAPNGIFILPVGINSQELIIIKKSNYDSFSKKVLMSVRFSMMPNE